MFNFEKLIVWQKAVGYADHIHEITSAFPQTEAFGLTSQMRRASVSISLNVAEGGRPEIQAGFRPFSRDSLWLSVRGHHAAEAQPESEIH